MIPDTLLYEAYLVRHPYLPLEKELETDGLVEPYLAPFARTGDGAHCCRLRRCLRHGNPQSR